MSKPRLLTKSRFKLGCECPSKLFFTGKKTYGNNNTDNAFLAALAEGGFQVGELAKLYHPDGIAIETLDVAEAIAQTAELLTRDNVVIYEAALSHASLLVRVDVLVKVGNQIQLIEVKAKSYDPSDEDPFYNKTLLKRGILQLGGDWKPYLLDIAFQTYVARNAFPSWNTKSFLMLADKSALASVDGLNQLFFLEKDAAGRPRVVVSDRATKDALGSPMLIKVPVDKEIEVAFASKFESRTFSEHVDYLSTIYKEDRRAPATIGSQCKGCEFRISKPMKKDGLQSGFDECWKDAAKLSDSELASPLVFDVWNYRGSQKLIESGRVLLRSVTEDDIRPVPRKGEPGLSSSERQWLQVKKIIEGDPLPYFDRDGISKEMSTWRYPLHFIDFETTMVAIPFHKGRRPYEQLAFQFSHHVVTADLKIEHRTEYINRSKGTFPNFDFVRALKTALSCDNGTIFRFAAHENTVLCQIYYQLKESEESDRHELMSWIQEVTESTDSSAESWAGTRTMVDMCDMVKRYLYHPNTGGSNSIKKVLPAVLSTSRYLQDRYSESIYGAANGIISKNYMNWRWIQRAPDGSIIDPYKLLPPVFSDLDLETMDSLITDGSIADGGAAMTAYARMQFTEMSDQEADRVCSALLKYCELDTFAMVLIYEYWLDLIKSGAGYTEAA